jgi:signal transduction histidine kinase
MGSAAASSAGFRIPPLRREGRLLAGVASGIADALRLDPIVVRASFVVLTVAGGLGVVLYAACWAVMAAAGGAAEDAPRIAGLGHTDRVLGLAVVTVGLVLLVDALNLGFRDSIARPVGLVGLGLLVAWHRGRLGALVEGDRSRLARVAVGLALAGAGVAGLVSLNLDLAQARDTILLSLAVVAGLVLVAAPTVLGLVNDLADERRERIRSQERARMAAHLHDSVLQTLALIQRHAHDPARMRSLARRQERELRSWLYGETEEGGATTVRSELDRLAADVEEQHGVPVELVVVGGEAAPGPREREAIAAAREAVVNAAKHSGAERVDVYAELRADAFDVFVRDTGVGFDPAEVSADRHGLRDSVQARMAHVGGIATITSAPGRGTEIELRLPREAG